MTLKEIQRKAGGELAFAFMNKTFFIFAAVEDKSLWDAPIGMFLGGGYNMEAATEDAAERRRWEMSDGRRRKGN
jgi:hypothetical protein